MSLILFGFLLFIVIVKKNGLIIWNKNRLLKVFMNEVEINNEQFEEISFNFSNPQIESNKTSQTEEEKTQKNP
jgi:hypothetical protein